MRHPTAATAARRIADLVGRGLPEEALRLYKLIHASGVNGGDTSFLPSVFKACSSPASFPLALQLHSILLRTGHDADIVTANSLLCLYSRHSQLEQARKLFDNMPQRDAASWSSMISCYSRNGYLEEPVELFVEMQQRLGVGQQKPELTAMALSLCGRMANLELGRQIHARSVCLGQVDTCVLLSTALVGMYARCYEFASAASAFESIPVKNEVTWTAMISACVLNGNNRSSFRVLKAMVAEGIVQPNRATVVTILPVCDELGSEALITGKEIHGYVLRRGLRSIQVSAALIDMYGRCKGGDALAWRVFDGTDERDVVTWSLMMRNCSDKGDCGRAMELFHRMQIEGAKPNSTTALALLSACIGSSTVDYSLKLHGFIVKSGLIFDVNVGNSLVHMYSKSGYFNSSVQVFMEMPVRDSVSWSCAISSCGNHGKGRKALELFDEMKERGVGRGDEIAWLAVLSACTHSGLVDEGMELFNLMARDCSTVPTLEHYACYVDLLGRSGRLGAACEVLREMPFRPSTRIWTSLVSACRSRGNFEAAQELAHWLIKSEPGDAASYTLLSKIHAETGNWSGVEEVRRVMKERAVNQNKGCSWIEY